MKREGGGRGRRERDLAGVNTGNNSGLPRARITSGRPRSRDREQREGGRATGYLPSLPLPTLPPSLPLSSSSSNLTLTEARPQQLVEPQGPAGTCVRVQLLLPILWGEERGNLVRQPRYLWTENS